MTNPPSPQQRARAVYDSAADRYDDPANAFWGRFGVETVNRLSLREGMSVLDVCCGSGASALPAARAVGNRGVVVGVDLSEGMLALARRKAAAAGLGNVTFRAGDLLDGTVAPGPFDAVICVFGIFFLPDMQAAARALWDRVGPGGRLAVTTWGPGTFEPLDSVFWAAVRREQPDLYRGFSPWDRIADPQALASLLESAGVRGITVEPVAATHPVPGPDAWWTTVMGSGYRGTIEQLTPQARARVRAACAEAMEREGIVEVTSGVVFAVAARE